MNEFLNNVFTAESVNAIKNAHEISPSPEQKEEVNYTDMKIESEVKHITEKEMPEMTQTIVKEQISQLERKLMQEITKQSERISAVINSQNQMIKELNALKQQSIQASKSQFEQKEAPVIKENIQQAEAPVAEKKKETQQTGAGEGLDPNDYSVEDIFYFGNNKK